MTDKMLSGALSRRTFLQVSAAGIVGATTLGGIGAARAEPYRNFTWISPRGSLEVLDDYGLWVGKKMGYFGDLVHDTQPGPSDGTAVVKFVDVGQADMGYPSPGVFSFALENGMKLKSVFHMGALDTFGLAFRKGEGTNDLKTLEGKTILLGSAAWQSIVDPMLAVQGVDVSKVKYVEAGWPTWSTALQAGQGDAALGWEGLRAEWIANGLDFEYWLGVKNSPLFANTFVVRAADLEDADKKDYLTKYLRGWAMGMEFAFHNPRAAVEMVFEQFPTLAANLGPEIGTVSILQQLAVNRGDMAARAGWGDHDMAKWQTFLDSIYTLGQVSTQFKAEDIATNELVTAANDFDKDKVKADAEAYVLSEAFEALDIENIKTHLYDQAVA
ncbi:MULTISPECIES: ABC transporter substrate-binding protein [unclassified Devosia]|uniref:ABC transporter substrate-binding protein n=1 Tax=unclassified Devosia TaxID=196773 RepID=UPI001553A21D|nr:MULTISPECIES: ABC transporter substrate-binding protein [unclassified Devosia]